MKSDLAIYVHIPFCARKCSYCDFNAYAGADTLVPEFVTSILEEIERAPEGGRSLRSVFFGGGTPTFLSSSQLIEILNAIKRKYPFQPDIEITTEANPTSSDTEKFRALREAGFNRISIGVQSFQSRLLIIAERDHSPVDATRAVEDARTAGFTNVSIDLIFGLPTQTRQEWKVTLESAVALQTEHLSLYALTIEPGTRFERLNKGRKLALPDEETELWMYEYAIQRLTESGFDHYEVSNFARPGYQSIHNRVYWLNEEYLGFGPGAVSYLSGRRWTDEKHPLRYIQKVKANDDLAVDSEELDTRSALGETMMVGLRLREGISLSRIRDRFHLDPLEVYQNHIEKVIKQGLLEIEGDRLKLTYRGLLVANTVLMNFIQPY
jgi:oxygen-independent coproporphyrinogen-3 oxidase